MKFGLRIPSFKKKLAARVSVKRFVRHSVGLKAPRGLGWFTNPKKALYNRVYNRTTFSLGDVFQGAGHASHGSAMIASQGAAYAAGAQHSGGSSSSGCVTVFVVALIITAIVGTVGRHLGDQAALIALAVVSLAGSVVWVAARRTRRAAAEARRVEYENLASEVQRQAVVQSGHVAVQQQELEASARRRAAKLLEEEAADAARAPNRLRLP
jgi:hypothetical protein